MGRVGCWVSSVYTVWSCVVKGVRADQTACIVCCAVSPQPLAPSCVSDALAWTTVSSKRNSVKLKQLTGPSTSLPEPSHPNLPGKGREREASPTQILLLWAEGLRGLRKRQGTLTLSADITLCVCVLCRSLCPG